MAETIKIDATGKPMGRLASRAAFLLQGKTFPAWRPERRESPPVIIYHVDGMTLTGKKALQDVRYRHSGYKGGLKTTPISRILAKDPRILLRKAIYGMLPKNRLRARMLKRLTLVRGVA